MKGLIIGELSLTSGLLAYLLHLFFRYRLSRTFGEVTGQLGGRKLRGALRLHVGEACKNCIFCLRLVESSACMGSHVIHGCTSSCLLSLAFVRNYLSLLLLRF